jgi:ubiquinone/menaquinone biosynthesis C-methylase UbiE
MERLDESGLERLKNIDPKTVESFGEEWGRFDQSSLSSKEHQDIFESYFSVFPWASLPPNAEGFDMGCGSGRWAVLVAPKVGKLNCIDPSPEALSVARKNLGGLSNVAFINAGVDDQPLAPGSQDFGYSLGVLHHIPDTFLAMKSCVAMLKPGAPFLVYLYYNFDNRPAWFRAIWKVSDILRKVLSKLPSFAKFFVTDVVAALVYWPLARTAALLESLGINCKNLPLYSYRDKSFYTMRTDSRDRFGTPLEQRFSRVEIQAMMQKCNLTNIRFAEGEVYWCAVGTKDIASA